MSPRARARRTPINQRDQQAEHGEADDDARRAEVDVQLHHLANANARAVHEADTGVVGDEVAAATDDWFVGPQRLRGTSATTASTKVLPFA